MPADDSNEAAREPRGGSDGDDGDAGPALVEVRASGWRRRDEVHWEEMDGDVLVEADKTVHQLQGASAVLWQLLDGSDLTGLCAEIADAFGVDELQVADDLAVALDQLCGAGLLEPAASEP